jgi:hypothetical protein
MPITFISHFRVKPGKAGDVRAMATMVSDQIEAAKPGTAAFLPYLGSDGATFSIVHVFADADAMADHFTGAEQRSSAAYELIEPAGWEIYGRPHARQLEALRSEATAAGVELRLDPEELPGFLRTPRI